MLNRWHEFSFFVLCSPWCQVMKRVLYKLRCQMLNQEFYRSLTSYKVHRIRVITGMMNYFFVFIYWCCLNAWVFFWCPINILVNIPTILHFMLGGNSFLKWRQFKYYAEFLMLYSDKGMKVEGIPLGHCTNCWSLHIWSIPLVCGKQEECSWLILFEFNIQRTIIWRQ
jgi:hypothetical protein